MSTGRSRSGGARRLNPCRGECTCVCHDTNGGVTEDHPSGYCVGKELTNTPEKLDAYRNHRQVAA